MDEIRCDPTTRIAPAGPWSRSLIRLAMRRRYTDSESLRCVTFEVTGGHRTGNGRYQLSSTIVRDHSVIECSVRVIGYHSSVAGSPARFQLQVVVGVIRVKVPGPTMPTRWTGSLARPYTRTPRATNGRSDTRSSTTNETRWRPARMLRILRVPTTVGPPPTQNPTPANSNAP